MFNTSYKLWCYWCPKCKPLPNNKTLFIYYKIVHEVQKYKVMQVNEMTRNS